MGIPKKVLNEVGSDWFDTAGGRAWVNKIRVTDQWVEFLKAREYDTFFTLTFRDPASSEDCALDRAARFLTSAFKLLHIPCSSFIVAEPHRLGNYHVHGLFRLGALDPESSKLIMSALWKSAWELYGRNRFEPVRDADRVRGYVAKYLVKNSSHYRFVP